MITGTYGVPRLTEESVCRSSMDYRFTEIGTYKIHSNALMPNIPFEEGLEMPYQIDSSIIINDKETKPDLPPTLKCQNYITARYIGRAPLEFYDKDNKTKMGREFVMICRGGKADESSRIFGTENAIRGYNRNANENVELPGGGDKQ